MKVTDTTSFIEKANKKHSNKYDYTSTVWVNSKEKVLITCPEHGEFSQSPNNHLSGYGCNECAKTARSKSQALPKSKFIDKANTIHNSIYNYDKVDYINSKTKVVITCQEHGDFLMAPSNHTHKTLPQGCPKCGIEARKDTTGWTDTEWETAGATSKYFDSYKLYFIRCFNETEQFYKIGKTFRTTAERFKNKTVMPYEWELITEKVGSAKFVSNLERNLHALIKPYHYTPEIPFGGSEYECFYLTEDVQKILDNI